MRVALISDLHLAKDLDDVQAGKRARLARVIREAKAGGVAAALLAGDITNACHPDGVALFASYAAELSVPVAVVPGNHDIGDRWLPGQPMNDESLDQYERNLGPLFFAREIADLRVVGITSGLFGSELAREKEQWEFLERVLRVPYPGVTALLLHNPLFVSEPDERGTYWNVEPDSRRRLLQLVAETGVNIVVSGHLHRPLINSWRGIDLVGVPAVSDGLPAGEQPEGWILGTFERDGCSWEIRNLA